MSYHIFSKTLCYLNVHVSATNQIAVLQMQGFPYNFKYIYLLAMILKEVVKVQNNLGLNVLGTFIV